MRRNKIYIILFVIIISIIISIPLSNFIKTALGIQEYEVNKFSHMASYIVRENILSDKHKDYLRVASQHNNLKIRLYDSLGNIHSIKYTGISKHNILRNEYFMFDSNADSLKELYFFYSENDSLFIMKINLLNIRKGIEYQTKYFVDYTEAENNAIEHLIIGDHMLSNDINNDGYNDIIAIYGTRFGTPRGIAVLDAHNNTVLRRVYSSCMPFNIGYFKDRHIVAYRGPHNGISVNGERDNGSKLEIRDNDLNLLHSFYFKGYSFFSTAIDSINSKATLLLFSHFNMEEFPSKIVTIDINTGKILTEKHVGKVTTRGKLYFTSQFDKGRAAGRSEKDTLYIYNDGGNIIKSIYLPDRDTPNHDNVCYSGIGYLDIFRRPVIFTYTDKSRLYNLNGEKILTSDHMLKPSIQSDFIRVIEDADQRYSNYFSLSKKDNYFILNLITFIIIAFIAIVLQLVIIYGIKYLWIAEMYRFLSVHTDKPAFILFRNRIISMNKAASYLLNEHDDAKEVVKEAYYRKKTFVIGNDYYQCEYISRRVLGIRFKAVIMENLTRDIEIAEFKALFDKIALLNHNIKNSMTSLLARKEIIEMQYRDMPDYINEFLKKVKSKAYEVSEISENIMNLAIGKLNYGDCPVKSLNAFIHEKYFADIRIHNNQDIETVYTDGRLLKYVMENLIDNAVHEINNQEDGYIEIHYKREGNDLIIEIFNTGSPLAEDEIERIMKGGYTTKLHGSGYGVFVSKNIINRLNGELCIYPEKRGNCIKIKLFNIIRSKYETEN
ncbi:MAG: HAMP domain-containing sensor histidine kinase [bacterium]